MAHLPMNQPLEQYISNGETMMKKFPALLLLLTVFSLNAVDLSGNREFIQLKWQNTMMRPVFTVSFRVKMAKKDMVIPEDVKNRGRVLFTMDAKPIPVEGLTSIKAFFQLKSFPTGGYAGFQAAARVFGEAKPEIARYNVFWRAENSQVPTGEFVRVTLSYCDGEFGVYINRNNIASQHKKVLLPMGFAAPEYVMNFGGMGKRHNVRCEIEDIAVFDRALTPDDLNVLLKNGTPDKIPGLRAFYPLKKNQKSAPGYPGFTLKVNKSKKR